MSKLLFKPLWNYKDVMEYICCGKTKAYELMNECRKHWYGGVKELPSFVKRDSFLAMIGTTADREILLRKEGKPSEETLQKREV